MCTPEAYIATQVLGSYTQYEADKDRAKRINEATDKQAQQLVDQERFEQNQNIFEKEKEIDKIAKDEFDLKTKALQTKSTANLLAGEKGIAGTLVDSLLGDVERQLGYNLTTLDQNFENLIRQFDANAYATNIRYSNQISSLPRAAKPSWGTYALQAGTNIAAMYAFNAAPKGTPNKTYGGGGADGTGMQDPVNGQYFD